MTSRTRSRDSRTPRGSNDIQYQMAQFPCGTHDPSERERVSRETHPDNIDFEDPMIAHSEQVIPENWKSAHQRTQTARDIQPIRECLYTKEEPFDPKRSLAPTDLTTAQKGIAFRGHHHVLHLHDFQHLANTVTALKTLQLNP